MATAYEKHQAKVAAARKALEELEAKGQAYSKLETLVNDIKEQVAKEGVDLADLVAMLKPPRAASGKKRAPRLSIPVGHVFTNPSPKGREKAKHTHETGKPLPKWARAQWEAKLADEGKK